LLLIRLATGATIRAAARAIHAEARRLIARAGWSNRLEELRGEVDEVIALVTPHHFTPLRAYENYAPVSDESVLSLSARSAQHSGGIATPARPPSRADDRDPVHRAPITASRLRIPVAERDEASDAARGLVILAHGTGSTRNSYRNRYNRGEAASERIPTCE